MDYKIALQLKNAGFPQPEEPTTGHYDSWILKNTYGEAYFKPENGDAKIVRLFPGMCYARDLVYVPTLDEIIDACGEKFLMLEKLYPPDETDAWWAKSKVVYETIGISKKEAVANLWLAINQN